MTAPIERIDTQPLVKPLARRMPKYKRTFLARQLRKCLKWVQRLMEEETSFNIAAHWSKATVTCKGCKTVLSGDSEYCSTCGRAQAELASPAVPASAILLHHYHATRSLDIDNMTGRITMGALPGESVKATIDRLRKLGAFQKR